MKKEQSSTFLSVYLIFFLALTLFTLTLVGGDKIKANIQNSSASEVHSAFMRGDIVETDIALFDRSGAIVNVRAKTEDMGLSKAHNALKALFEIKGNVEAFKNAIPDSWRFEGITIEEDTAVIRLSSNVKNEKTKPYFKNAMLQVSSTVKSHYPEISKIIIVSGDDFLTI